MLTIAVIICWPRPVMVITPAMIPATPHAQATVRVLRAPFSNASTKPFTSKEAFFRSMPMRQHTMTMPSRMYAR